MYCVSVCLCCVELCAGVNIVVGGDANNVSAWNTSNSNGRLDTLNSKTPPPNPHIPLS